MTAVQEAPTQHKPALARVRTDMVGSLLRPQIVKEARIAFDDGKITAERCTPSRTKPCVRRCGCRRTQAST